MRSIHEIIRASYERLSDRVIFTARKALGRLIERDAECPLDVGDLRLVEGVAPSTRWAADTFPDGFERDEMMMVAIAGDLDFGSVWCSHRRSCPGGLIDRIVVAIPAWGKVGATNLQRAAGPAYSAPRTGDPGCARRS